MSIKITGDTHSFIFDRLSFKNCSKAKTWTKDDILIILGDFGCVWHNKNHELHKSDKHKLNWLNNQKYTTIAIGGNHENYDEIATYPIVEKFNGHVRQLREKVFFVDSPQVLTIENKLCLCIPGATSLDKAYRTIGTEWWPQEKINVKEAINIIDSYKDIHFDYIFTHDAPSSIYNWFEGGIYRFSKLDYGQNYLETLRQDLSFDKWFHGHFHINYKKWLPDPRMYSLYEEIVEENEDE